MQGTGIPMHSSGPNSEVERSDMKQERDPNSAAAAPEEDVLIAAPAAGDDIGGGGGDPATPTTTAAAAEDETKKEAAAAAAPESGSCGCTAFIKRIFNSQQQPKENGSSLAVPHLTTSGTPQSTGQVPGNEETAANSLGSSANFHFVTLPRGTQVPPSGRPSPIHN